MIKNLKKAAARLKKAVKNKEPIVLYGDSDLDGVCSAIIMQETLKSLGGTVVAVYFPDREKDGYGITEKALQQLKELTPALLVAMDLGISNFKEVDLAKKAGFEVLLVDHHQVIDKLPNADIIVDPMQPGDASSFKELAACGLTLKVAEEVLGKKISSSLRSSLVELAAIGTIADMMPREADNKEIIEEGMEAIKDSWRPGIRAFFSVPEFQNFPNIESRLQKMISILNVRDVEDGFPASFRILSNPSERAVSHIVEKLLRVHAERKERATMLLEKTRRSIEEKQELPLVFEGGEGYDYILLGTIASVTSQEEGKPSFIYKKRDQEAIGSVRAPSGVDTVQAMKHCGNLLITFGGHPQASGFRIKNANLPKFQKCLIDYFNRSHP